MSFTILATISGLKKLRKTSINLSKLKDSISSGEFTNLLKDFESDIDRLNKLLTDHFGEDSEIQQMIYELKSAAFTLKTPNVETGTSLVETKFQH